MKCTLEFLTLFQQWDDTIATAAQEIADTCEFEHQTVNDGKLETSFN